MYKRQHLYSLTAVKLDGESVQFRYYDPRVLRPFWQVLNPEEKNQLMGPIECLIVEDEQQRGFWAYQRPKDLKPPPYPPTPKDWTSLPEPWWTIIEPQQQALQTAFIEHFLHGFASHLTEARDVLRPDYAIDFHSTEQMHILRIQANYLLKHGFETDYDLACALEQVQIFNLRLDNPKIRAVIENKNMTNTEKLCWFEEKY